MAALHDEIVEAEKARLRQIASERPKVVLTKHSTKAEVAAFRAGVAAEAAEVAAAADAQTTEHLTARERTFNELLGQMWNDVTWMCNANGFLGIFPDGRPKAEQHPWHLTIWAIFITALMQRANRPPKGASDEREADGT